MLFAADLGILYRETRVMLLIPIASFVSMYVDWVSEILRIHYTHQTKSISASYIIYCVVACYGIFQEIEETKKPIVAFKLITN